MMKRVVCGALVCACVALSRLSDAGAAEAGGKQDFSWWQRAGSEARAAAVRATMLAVPLAWDLGYAAEHNDATRILVENHADDAVLWAVEHARPSRRPTYVRSIAFYVAKVSQIYAAHPRARSVEVPEIMYTCLSGNTVQSDCDRLLKQ
jgi:hypothetical protein